jgi:nucleoside-diphosphate-sugar epimerase
VDRQSSKTHVLITGGAGFIGQRLAGALLASGARVTVLTRNVGRPAAQELRRRGATLVGCDVSTLEPADLARVADGSTVLCHFAADVSVAGPGLRATNVDGTRRLLDAAAALDVPYVVAASSIEAQGPGSSADVPLAEDAPARPVTPYGETKLAMEQVVRDWSAATGRPAAVLRIGNVYGPGSPWLLRASLAALVGAAPLAGAYRALASRELQPLYVDDLAQAVRRIVDARPAGLFNVAGAERVTLAGYLFTLARLAGLERRLADVAAAAPADGRPEPGLDPDLAYFLIGRPDAPHRVYDSRRIQDVIGAYARRALDRGLAATLAWAWAGGLLGPREGGATACTAR